MFFIDELCNGLGLLFYWLRLHELNTLKVKDYGHFLNRVLTLRWYIKLYVVTLDLFEDVIDRYSASSTCIILGDFNASFIDHCIVTMRIVTACRILSDLADNIRDHLPVGIC